MKKSQQLDIEVSNIWSHIRTEIATECNRIAKGYFKEDMYPFKMICLPEKILNFTDGDRTVSITGIQADGIAVSMSDDQGMWMERLTADRKSVV